MLADPPRHTYRPHRVYVCELQQHMYIRTTQTIVKDKQLQDSRAVPHQSFSFSK